MAKSIRVNKKRGYTVIPNGLLPEGNITARAWGLYAYLLSRPDGWVIHVRQLQKVFKEGREALYTALRQLREAGLLEMESYKEPGQPPKQRFVLVDIDVLLANSPDTGSWDTGNRNTDSRDLNHYLLKPDLKESNKEINPPPSSAGDYFTVDLRSTDTFHEQPSVAHEKLTAKQYDDHLPKEQWNHLKRLLQLTGEAIRDTEDFYSPVSQDRWSDFETALEDHTMDLPYHDMIVDLTQNGKWTVNAKVADWYKAGAELLTLFNTARSIG